jgi:hypothetical protein
MSISVENATIITQTNRTIAMLKQDFNKLKEEDENNDIFVCFDIESMLVKNNDRYDHTPNLLSSAIVCNKCKNNKLSKEKSYCEYCGDYEFVTSNATCIQSFIKYVLTRLAPAAKKQKSNVLCAAHNLSGYDGQFIFREILAQNYRNVEPILNGMIIFW